MNTQDFDWRRDADAVVFCSTDRTAVYSGRHGAVLIRQSGLVDDEDDIIIVHRTLVPILASALLREAYHLDDAPEGEPAEAPDVTLKRCGVVNVSRIDQEDTERLAAYITRLEQALSDLAMRAGAVLKGGPSHDR